MIRNLRQAIVVVVCVFALTSPGVTQAQTVPPKPGPKAGKYAAAYKEMEKPSWKGGFPNLGSYEILAPYTGREDKKGAYNCIAHTLRVYDKWVWPGKTVADFDRLYGGHGYKRIRGLDYRFNASTDKIVLYAKRLPNGEIECTHGSRQLADGTWTSKLGGGPMIRHATPASVGGPSYGQPIAVYVKPRKTTPIIPLPPAKNTRVNVARKTNPPVATP